MIRAALLLALTLVGCKEPSAAPDTGTSDAAPVTPATAPAAEANPASADVVAKARPAEDIDVFARAPRYTSLEDCPTVRSNPEDGYSVQRCQGHAGFTLERNESDGRQNLFVVSADSVRSSLNLPGLIGSGFSSLGPRAEWVDGASGSTALIVRYEVAARPEISATTSHLVVARVQPGAPCLIGDVPPGPGQNEAARRLADANGSCLTSRS